MENDGRKESTDAFRERKFRQMQAANELLVKRRAQHSTTVPEKQTRRDTAQPVKEITRTHFQVSGHTGVFQHVDVKGSDLHTGGFFCSRHHVEAILGKVPIYPTAVRYNAHVFQLGICQLTGKTGWVFQQRATVHHAEAEHTMRRIRHSIPRPLGM